MTFAVVHFIDTNELEVIPYKWIENDKCHFPDSKVAGLLARKNGDVDCGWPTFDVRVLKTLGELVNGCNSFDCSYIMFYIVFSQLRESSNCVKKNDD
jgi:hypothetical protein